MFPSILNQGDKCIYHLAICLWPLIQSFVVAIMYIEPRDPKSTQGALLSFQCSEFTCPRQWWTVSSVSRTWCQSLHVQISYMSHLEYNCVPKENIQIRHLAKSTWSWRDIPYVVCLSWNTLKSMTLPQPYNRETLNFVWNVQRWQTYAQ